MFTMAKVKYEEELCGAQEDNERQRQLLDAVYKQPRVVLNRADVTEKYLRPDEQKVKSPQVKEEEEEHPYFKEEKKSPGVKKEEVEDDVTKSPMTLKSSMTFAPLKSEDEVKGRSVNGGRPFCCRLAIDG
ncbi:uncharacterized protein LOC144006191 [Festucalex cinctus]